VPLTADLVFSVVEVLDGELLVLDEPDEPDEEVEDELLELELLAEVDEFEEFDELEEFDEFEVEVVEPVTPLEVVALVAEEVALLVRLFFVVTFLLLFFAGVVVCVTTAAVVGLLLAAGAVVVTAMFEVAAEAPAIEPIRLDAICGGVTDKTAPRPPTVPPAISSARFMPYLFSLLPDSDSGPRSRPFRRCRKFRLPT